MRLIDADVLKTERGMADRCEDCKHDARMCQNNQDYTRMDICGMLDDAPTIDAIPVWWLCQKAREEGERDNILKAEYIKDLIWEWHQQEGVI